MNNAKISASSILTIVMGIMLLTVFAIIAYGADDLKDVDQLLAISGKPFEK